MSSTGSVAYPAWPAPWTTEPLRTTDPPAVSNPPHPVSSGNSNASDWRGPRRIPCIQDPESGGAAWISTRSRRRCPIRRAAPEISSVRIRIRCVSPRTPEFCRRWPGRFLNARRTEWMSRAGRASLPPISASSSDPGPVRSEGHRRAVDFRGPRCLPRWIASHSWSFRSRLLVERSPTFPAGAGAGGAGLPRQPTGGCDRRTSRVSSGDRDGGPRPDDAGSMTILESYRVQRCDPEHPSRSLWAADRPTGARSGGYLTRTGRSSSMGAAYRTLSMTVPWGAGEGDMSRTRAGVSVAWPHRWPVRSGPDLRSWRSPGRRAPWSRSGLPRASAAGRTGSSAASGKFGIPFVMTSSSCQVIFSCKTNITNYYSENRWMSKNYCCAWMWNIEQNSSGTFNFFV